MNKRHFLARSGQTLLGGALAAQAWTPAFAAAEPASAQAGDAAPGPLGRGMDHWQALVGTAFTAWTPIKLPTSLTLTEVRPCKGRAPGLEQFTLVFQGPSRRQLPAGLHALTAGPRADQVYLEPVLHEAGLSTYTASFSLIAQA